MDRGGRPGRQKGMGRLASVCLVVTLASLGLWACTEYVAGQLEYAPELGPPLAILGGVRLYAPWGWMEWIDEWSSGSAVNVFRSVLLVEFVAALAFVCGALLGGAGWSQGRPSAAEEE